MSFDIAWTELFKWWRKPLGYHRLMRARRRYGVRLALKKRLSKRGLLTKKVGYQELIHRLSNVHEGRRCFIIGNGASLRKMDLSPLKGEITIGSNEIYRLFPRLGFNTSYLTVEDTAFCEDKRRELKNVKGPIKIFGLHNAYCVPVDKRTLFINICHREGSDALFSEDCAAIVYSEHSATYLNLQLAFHFGCNPVYLVGVDYDYDGMEREFGPGTIKVTEEVIERLRDIHFDPDCYRMGDRFYVPNQKRLYATYKMATEFYDWHGRKVVDAGIGDGHCVFERTNFHSLFTNPNQEQGRTLSFGIGACNINEVLKMVDPKAKSDRSRKYYEKALKLCKDGHPERALGYLNKSIECRPNALAFYLMASVMKSLGRHEESSRIFRKILDDERLHVDRNVFGGSHFHLGELDFRAGDYSGAKSHFVKCLEAIPSHGKAGEYLRVIRAEGLANSSVRAEEALVP